MRFFCIEYVIVGLLVVGLSDGLQSSKKCVFLALSMQMAVSWLLACWAVYIIQEIRFFCSKYAIVGRPVAGLLDNLQLSKGCVPLALDMQLLLLAYQTGYNHPKDAFLLR